MEVVDGVHVMKGECLVLDSSDLSNIFLCVQELHSRTLGSWLRCSCSKGWMI